MNERIVTVTEASRNFADLVNRSYYKGESTILLRGGDAVARIGPVGGSSLLGRDLAARWGEMSHLSPKEAEKFAEEIETAREELKMPESAWD